MSDKERAERYCDCINGAQKRMARGAMIAFDRSDPARQRAACRRMLVYIRLIRWLYARALRADEATALAFRAACVGKTWPFGGIDDGDTAYFALIGQYGCEDVAESVPCPVRDERRGSVYV